VMGRGERDERGCGGVRVGGGGEVGDGEGYDVCEEADGEAMDFGHSTGIIALHNRLLEGKTGHIYIVLYIP